MLMETSGAIDSMVENSTAVHNNGNNMNESLHLTTSIVSQYLSQSSRSQIVPRLKLKEIDKKHIKIVKNCNRPSRLANKMANAENKNEDSIQEEKISDGVEEINRISPSKEEQEQCKTDSYIHRHKIGIRNNSVVADNNNYYYRGNHNNNTHMMLNNNYKQELDVAFIERCQALDAREVKREREYKYKLEQTKSKMEEEIKHSMINKYCMECEEKLENYVQCELNQLVDHFTGQWELLVEQTKQILEEKDVYVEQEVRNARLSNEEFQSEIRKLQRELEERETLRISHTSRHEEKVSKLTEECVKAQSEITMLRAEMNTKDSQIKSLLMEMEVIHEEFTSYKTKKAKEYEHKTSERYSVMLLNMEEEHNNKMSKLNEWQNQLTEYAAMLDVEHKAAFAKMYQQEEECKRVKMHLALVDQYVCTWINNVVVTYVEQMHKEYLQLRENELIAVKHLLNITLQNNNSVIDKNYYSDTTNELKEEVIAAELLNFNERVVKEMYTNYENELQKWFASELQTQSKQAAQCLQETRDQYEARLQEVYNENTCLSKEIERVENEHANTITKLKEEHKSTMTNVKNKYELQIDSILTDAAAKEKECMSQYELQLTECSDTYDVQLREAKARFAKELHDKENEIASQHATQTAELQRNHQSEVEEIANELHAYYHNLIKEEKQKWWEEIHQNEQQQQQQQLKKQNDADNHNEKVNMITCEREKTNKMERESLLQKMKQKECNSDNNTNCKLEEIHNNNNGTANLKNAPVQDELERAIQYIRELWNLLKTPQAAQDAFLNELQSASSTGDRKVNETVLMSLIYKELAKREAELKIAELYTRRDYCTFQLNELATNNTCNNDNKCSVNDNKENTLKSSKNNKKNNNNETVEYTESKRELQNEITHIDARITRALHEYECSYNEIYIHQGR